MKKEDKEELRRRILKKYADIVKAGANTCGCSSSCCNPQASSSKDLSNKLGYSSEELNSVPVDSNMGLGCGNPQAIAMFKKGETVLDLGCGGGFDCFLAAKQVGGNGHVIGIDMTPDMISKACENAQKGNYNNVEFRLGEIESLPVSDNSVDVIISNCVINLSSEKSEVFQEAYRILKPEGRLAIFDVVAISELPESIKNDREKQCGCIAGAATVEELQSILERTGFKNIRIKVIEHSKDLIRDWFPESNVENYVRSASIEASK